MNSQVKFSLAIVFALLILGGLIAGACLLFYGDSLLPGIMITTITGALVTVFIYLLVSFGVAPPEPARTESKPGAFKTTKRKRGRKRERKGTYMAVKGQSVGDGGSGVSSRPGKDDW